MALLSTSFHRGIAVLIRIRIKESYVMVSKFFKFHKIEAIPNDPPITTRFVTRGMLTDLYQCRTRHAREESIYIVNAHQNLPKTDYILDVAATASFCSCDDWVLLRELVVVGCRFLRDRHSS